MGPFYRVDDAAGPPAHPVVGPPHPLQSRRDRRRWRHLEHQVDGTDIDPELE